MKIFLLENFQIYHKKLNVNKMTHSSAYIKEITKEKKNILQLCNTTTLNYKVEDHLKYNVDISFDPKRTITL